MSGTVVDILLAVGAGSCWLGCVGFARLSDAFDRLHCNSFVGVAAGFPVLLASFGARGADASVLKVLLLVACTLLNGAALSHATGRALLYRSEDEGGAP